MHETSKKIRLVGIVLLAFASGAVLSGLFLHRQRSATTGELDNQYALEYRRAAETIGRLEEELGRERELTRELREHNNRAREIASGLTDTTERNVRNLQEAVGLINEIREKLKVLADFYADSDPGGGSP